MKKLKTIFLGNPTFSLPALKALFNSEYIELSAVCGSPDKPNGRGKKIQSPATVEYAKKNNIKIFQNDSINKDEKFIKYCEEEKPDIFIVLAFSHFLSQRILDLPKVGCFNIHTSILPKYRGSSPIHYALLNGDQSTGVSIQKMVKKMDAGDIGHFESQKISADDNYKTLSEKLSNLSASALIDFMNQIATNKASFYSQKENEVTFAPLIKKTDGLITFLENAIEILNKTKAFYIWPGTFFEIGSIAYKFKNIKIHSSTKPSPGKIKITSKEIYIDCLDATIELLDIQPPGKPIMSATSFLNGYKFEKDQVEK
jgi:methionyl-tRNA formyltransferase